ncbi:AAA family ATPase [Peptoniphilus sp. EMRHCC_23]|uniref:ATP-binding protein n=1 Tax=Peptoniphilus rachelemmaiella TaxID=2811779 RepID=UPI001C00190D|nr:AAA family ATPase [Peptoniphilus rachelemmaiella]
MIHKLYMRDFGCFHDTTVAFQEGYQCLPGPNESGKTTTAACIQAILYGFSKDSPARKLYSSAYDDYFPLEGRDFSAAMELEVGGKPYVIERNFIKEKETLKIYDVEANRFLSDEDALYTFSGIPQPGALFWQLSQGDFLRFFAMDDLQSTGAEAIFKRVQEMKNFLRTNSTALNVEGALDYLAKEKKALGTERAKKSPIGDNREKLKGMEANLADFRARSRHLKDEEEKREALLRELRALKLRQKQARDKELLLPQLAVAAEEVAQWDRALDENEAKIEHYERKRGKGLFRGIYYKLALLFGCVAAAIAVVFMTRDRADFASLSALAAGGLFVVALILFVLRRLTLRNIQRYHRAFYERDQLLEKKNARFHWFDNLVEEDITMEELLDAMKRRMKALEHGPLETGLDDKIEALQRQVGQVDARREEKDAIEKKMEKATKAYKDEQARGAQLSKKLALVEACESILRALDEGGREDFNRAMLEDGARYLRDLSRGRYKTIALSEDAFVLQKDDGHWLKETQLSRSTADLLVLSLRLAAVEKMDPSIPMIFDDGFVYLDEGRRGRLKDVLKKLNRQVIEFTTPKRERSAD